MVCIIDGNKIARDIRNEVRKSAIELEERKGIIPGGVGPMTIVMLMKNILDSSARSLA